MLCPNCGTEVGDQLGLCARCASYKSGDGESIGAIRPALKVVHLKPGQTAEDYQSSAKNVSSGFGRSESPVMFPETEKRSRAPLVTALILIFGALVSLLYLFFASREFKEFGLNNTAQNHEKTDFSHIVIHEKKEVKVDGVNVFGVIHVAEQHIALGLPRAFYEPRKYTLEIHYPPAGTVLGPDQSEPLVRLWLQFGKLGNKLERDKLQSYMIEYLADNKPYRIVRTYSRHLADFAEVSLISSGARVGEKVRGSLQSGQALEQGPINVQISWELTFDSQLEAVGKTN